jgi:16S rRNA (uracil1498-N3)-methyltransferase
LVAVGAEGGFSVREAELARSHGFEPVHLGRRILRAETAALAVLSLVQFLWGDLTST